MSREIVTRANMEDQAFLIPPQCEFPLFLEELMSQDDLPLADEGRNSGQH